MFPVRSKMDYRRIKLNYNYKYTQDTKGGLPHGLWYSYKDDWLKRGTSYKGVFLHSVILHANSLTNIHNPDPNKILVIKNSKDLETFNDLYGTLYSKGKFQGIRWKEVSKHFGGIEFFPYLSTQRKKYDWYAMLDASSGCVWNLKAIVKEVKFVRKISNYDDYDYFLYSPY